MTLRVALGDDSYLAREGISRALESDEGIEIVAACADVEELRAAATLRRTSPGVGVVVLSQFVDPAYARTW